MIAAYLSVPALAFIGLAIAGVMSLPMANNRHRAALVVTIILWPVSLVGLLVFYVGAIVWSITAQTLAGGR